MTTLRSRQWKTHCLALLALAAMVTAAASPGVVRPRENAQQQGASTSGTAAEGDQAAEPTFNVSSIPYTPEEKCGTPSAWTPLAARLSMLLEDVIYISQRSPNTRPPVALADLLAENVSGNINVLGPISSYQDAAMYLDTLPARLLAANNLTVVGLLQTHYSVTCNVAAAVHHISLRETEQHAPLPPPPPPVNPKPGNQANLPTPAATPMSRNVRALFQQFINRRAAAAAEAKSQHSAAQQEQGPVPEDSGDDSPSGSSPGSEHEGTPTWLPHVLAVWSWWKFDRDGKVVEFDVAIHPRDGDRWGPGRRTGVRRVCAEFSAGWGRCAAAPDAFPWPGEDECAEGMTQLHHAVSSKLTCRLLHLPLLDSPVAGDRALACRELGSQPRVCRVPGVPAWTQPRTPPRARGHDAADVKERVRRAASHHSPTRGKALDVNMDLQPRGRVVVEADGRRVGAGAVEAVVGDDFDLGNLVIPHWEL
ncbi:hypothetical protein BC828DRAFT_385439 [Blastocladiella britannica]|nr:hypothetical protein BC828DRAFT_385439 [Blastocladiella britannica]